MKYLNPILIWFGAAVSIAEIFTGTLFAPLGLKMGITIILLGHLIGCILMYLVGLISTNTNLSTMKSTQRSFGSIGSYFFASFNGIQLIGWTAVMIYSGANAANILIPSINIPTWSLLISALIILWLIVKFRDLGLMQIIVITALFILSLFISTKIIATGTLINDRNNSLSIFNALELSIAMPLSWLPLIGDYTQNSNKDKKITLYSSITYFFASSWMYIVGLSCALFAKENNFAIILSKLGMGKIGILIIILSTVTTTFLDAFSCGVSFSFLKTNEKIVSILCVIIGLFIALFFNQSNLETFLYLISSIFVPMAAIQISDYFFIKKDVSKTPININNFIIFAIAFILYRVFLNANYPISISLAIMLITSILVILNNIIFKEVKKYDSK